MRDYVPYYAQIVEPLQSQKTEMLKGLTKSGAKQKWAARSIRLVDPMEKERALFDCLQAFLSKEGFSTTLTQTDVCISILTPQREE